ncbi:MAG: hypothetical protein K2N78_03630 [Oscillospiraceae bacterium]|nr:hypothetical protein [Oscillospiraceae bacterium]
MRQPPTNICPLLAIAGIGGNNGPAVCLEDCCAWWDHLAGSCCIAAGAGALQDIAASLEELTADGGRTG